jgi:NAD(P)-dependent dehydrogenase (short-subunit alcohol dehydrogenase family)
MVAIKVVRESNAALKAETPGLVALFAGATNGIGLSTLKELVKDLNAPRVYIVGRSKEKFRNQVAELELLNPEASIKFIEAQVSLLKDVDDLCKDVSSQERKLDLLYMSPGYLAFGGPECKQSLCFCSSQINSHNFNSCMEKDTCEGIDTCLSVSYYARMRLTFNLLPLLKNSQAPKVLSVLAGGQERRLLTHDLGLKENYSILNVMDQATTMHTLAFEHLAQDHQSISFLHAYPGWVRTDIVKNLFEGRQRGYLRTLASNWLILPLFNLIATSVEESGERQVFHATSRRYASKSEQQQDAESVSKKIFAECSVPGSGVYRVAANGETLSDSKVLDSYRKDHIPERIWEHTIGVFEEALTKGNLLPAEKWVSE